MEGLLLLACLYCLMGFMVANESILGVGNPMDETGSERMLGVLFGGDVLDGSKNGSCKCMAMHMMILRAGR